MINAIKAGGAAPEASLNQRSPEREPAQPPPREEGPAKPAADPKPDSNLRLVIERDEDKATYVYRLIDRVTGKVVVELPRGKVSELASTPTYEAGALVSTKA